MNRLFEFFRDFRVLRTSASGMDRWLLVVTGALLLIGTVAIHSTTITSSGGSLLSPYLLRQLLYIVIGLVVAMGVWMMVPLRMLRDRALLFVMIAIGTLLLSQLPFIGVSSKGASRWIDLGFFNVQPVEYVKPLMLVYLCSYCSANRESLDNVRGLFQPAAVLAVASCFLFFQPDFGSIVILAALMLAVIFLAGVSMRIISTGIGLASAMLIAAVVFEPYRLRRLSSFLDPFADPYGDGYQQTHSLMAFGKGRWFGEGLGQSVEKWSHLPDAHTDFIIAVIAEETGIIGFALLLGLYCLILWRAFSIAAEADAGGKMFNALLARSIGLMLIGQMTINVSGNLALGPVKGLTLPLVSYGGSSLVAWLATLALLQILAHDNRFSAAHAHARNTAAC